MPSATAAASVSSTSSPSFPYCLPKHGSPTQLVTGLTSLVGPGGPGSPLGKTPTAARYHHSYLHHHHHRHSLTGSCRPQSLPPSASSRPLTAQSQETLSAMIDSKPKKAAPAASLRRVSLHGNNSSSIAITTTVSSTRGTSQPRISHRRTRSCCRVSSKSRARSIARDLVARMPDNHTLPRCLETKREPICCTPSSSSSGFSLPPAIDPYHEQTLKLKDMVDLHRARRKMLLAHAVQQIQQLDGVHQTMAAVRRLQGGTGNNPKSTIKNSARAKASTGCKKQATLATIPPTTGEELADLKQTLQWQARVIDEQLLQLAHSLEHDNSEMLQIFLDMMHGPRHESFLNKINKHHLPSHVVRVNGRGPGNSEGPHNEVCSAAKIANEPGHAFPVNELYIPDWFVVLEARRNVHLLSVDRANRYVELLNKIHRLGKEIQGYQNLEEEEDACRGVGQTHITSPERSDNPAVLLDGPGDYGDPPDFELELGNENCGELNEKHTLYQLSHRPSPVSSTATNSKEHYGYIMAEIDACMAIVAQQDKKSIMSRRPVESVINMCRLMLLEPNSPLDYDVIDQEKQLLN